MSYSGRTENIRMKASAIAHVIIRHNAGARVLEMLRKQDLLTNTDGQV